MFFSVGLFILRRPICVKTRECEGEKSLGLFFYSVFVPDAYDFLIVNVCKDLEALSSWDVMMLGSIFPGEDYFSQQHNLGVCISVEKKLKTNCPFSFTPIRSAHSQLTRWEEGGQNATQIAGKPDALVGEIGRRRLTILFLPKMSRPLTLFVGRR